MQVLIVQLSGKVASKLTNTTIYKQMNDSFADKPFVINFDEFVDKGYHYGRDLISGSFFSLIRNSDDRAGAGPFPIEDPDHSVDEFEGKVLELWDRLYQVRQVLFLCMSFFAYNEQY